MTDKRWMHIFACNLLWAMETEGVSQRELSRKTGISENTISNYVNENRKAEITNVIKIADALHYDIRDLIY